MLTLFKPYENELTAVITNTETDSVYGSNNLALHVEDDSSSVLANRKCLAEQLACNQLVFPEQTHSSNVQIATSDRLNYSDCDALITNEKHLAIAVLTADCVPVLLYDPQQKVIGVVHSGWRGTMDGIVEATLELMASTYKSKASDVVAVIGPCISQANYEVSQELADAFTDHFSAKVANGRKLDLVQCVVQQLSSKGVIQIELTYTCTFEEKQYYSARRLGFKSGRFASVLMLR